MANTVWSHNSLTFKEWHAAVLGVVIGAVSAYLRVIGFTTVGVALVVLFICGALGVRVYDGSVAGQTITREPWYALAAMVITGAIVLGLTG